MRDIDCQVAADMRVSLAITGDELVILNNALAVLIEDEAAMDDMFCGDCKSKVLPLLDRIHKKIGTTGIEET